MNLPEFNKIKHLYNRFSFGWPITALPDNFEEAQRKLWVGKIQPIRVTEASSTDRMRLLSLSTEERRRILKGRHEELRALNTTWIKTLASDTTLLNEKMAFFWHGHFACRNGIPFYMEEMVNLLRRDCLSDFKTLLTNVCKSAAMLQFLNNQQNRKAQPNENFARELLELFTLGRGNYTEKDIKEAARAFTGWGFDESGAFEFRERLHDNGIKTFMGETGNHDGDDIIRIILSQKQCATFICTKIWRQFISQDIEPDRIQELADIYYKQSYDTGYLVSYIMNSSWFYEEKYCGALIKSPVELMVPLIRDFKIQFKNEQQLILIQRILGQVLLFPPNVAGWPSGNNWIDSSSLIYRMKLARVLITNEADDVQPKDDGDVNGFARMTGESFRQDRLNVISDWFAITALKEVGSIPWHSRVIAVNNWSPDEKLLSRYKLNSEDHLKELIIHLMTLPEYQLC